MAGLVLGVAGAAVGSFFGPTGAQIGWAIGSTLGNTLFAETQKIEGQRLNNLSIQTNTNGAPKVRGWGTFRTAGNIIWTSGYIETKNVETQGGKGGPEVQTTSYSYSINVAIAIHDGEINAVRRVWANKKLVADFSDSNTGFAGNIEKYMTIYKGDEFQEPDSLMQQYTGEYTPAYRGTAYVVFNNLPLEEFGNQLPQFEFEIVVGNLSSSQINYITVPTYTTASNIGYLYENTVNKHLYTFASINNGIQKINQDSMTVVESAENLFSFSGSSSGVNYNQITNDFSGNLYRAGSVNISGTNYGCIWKLDKDTLQATYYRAVDYAPLTSIGGISGGSLYTKKDNIGLLYFGKRLIAANYTKIGTINFEMSPAITGSGLVEYTLTQSRIGGGTHIPNGYHKENNTIYFTSHITTDFISPFSDYDKPCLNSITGGLLNENIVQLSNDGINKYPHHIQIDELRNKLYIILTDNELSTFTKCEILKINLNNGTIESKIEFPALSLYDSTSWYYNPNIVFNISNNTLTLFNNNANVNKIIKYNINCADFTYSQIEINESELGNATLNNQLENSIIYSSKILGVIGAGQESIVETNPLFLFAGTRYSRATYPLKSIVEELCVETGLDLTDIDATELQLINVKGFKIDNQLSARQVLETLSIYYNFDAVESGGILKFILRGKDPVATIDYSEIGAKIFTKDYDSSDIFKNTRIQESELVKILNIIYFDIDKDYEQNTQQAKRVINTTENVNTIQAPIVLDSTEAKRIVDRILYQSYIARDKYQFDINYDYAYLEPTDVINLIKDGNTYTLRITKLDKSQGVLKIEAEAEQKTVYNQNGTGDAGIISQDVVTTYADTSLYILDIPIFDISDNNGGNYVVVDKSAGLWRGAGVYKSTEQNGTYSSQETIYQNSITGNIQSFIDSNHILNTVDYVSYFIIQSTGQLYSITYDQLLNGGNVALIGNELVQFMNAELIATNTYKISGLLRGRWATEQYVGTHTINDKFILFNFYNSSLKRINKSDYIYGVPRYYKGVTIRTQIDDVTNFPFTNNAIGLKPLAVVNVMGSRNNNNDLYVEFKKRIRGQAVFGNTLDTTDPDGDYYEIDIYNGLNVVRTIYSTSLNFTYTAAQQTTDFGSIQSSINIKIYKVNNSYGRGFEKSIIL